MYKRQGLTGGRSDGYGSLLPPVGGFLYSKTSLRQLLHHPSRQGPREKHGFSGEGLDPFLHFHGIADAVQDDEIGVGGDAAGSRSHGLYAIIGRGGQAIDRIGARCV